MEQWLPFCTQKQNQDPDAPSPYLMILRPPFLLNTPPGDNFIEAQIKCSWPVVRNTSDICIFNNTADC